MKRRTLITLRAPARIDKYDPRHWDSVGAYEDAVVEWQERNPLLMTPLGVFQRRLAARQHGRKR